MKGEFRDATKAEPCPICDGESWCRISVDGNRICCRRKDSHPTHGVGSKKSDRNGAPLWHFYLGERKAPNAPPTRHHSEGKANPSTPSERDTVYRRLIELLPTTRRVRDELDRRGVPDDALLRKRCKWLPLEGRAKIAAQLVSEGFEAIMARTPGFIVREGQRGDYWTISGVVGMVIPVLDPGGFCIGICIRPENPVAGRKYVYLSSSHKGGAKAARATHCPLYDGNKSDVGLTEGILKADVTTAISGKLYLGLPGLSSRDLLKTLKKLKASTVRLALDADAVRNPQVMGALETNYRRLSKAGIEVRLERWAEADGKGIDDLYAAGKSPQVLTGPAVGEWITQTKAALAETQNRGRKQVVVDENEAEVVRTVIGALATGDERLYHRNGQLVEVGRVTIDGQAKPSPKIIPLTTPNIRTRITDVCELIKNTGEGLKPTNPPDWLAPAVRDDNHWDGIRRLVAVTTSPVLRPDGTIFQEPGYDHDTGLLYIADDEYAPIPEKPTQTDAQAAIECLRSGVFQFPWESEVDFSAWISAVVSMAVRYAFYGPVPLYCLTANAAGSGKTSLAKAAAIISTGREMPDQPFPIAKRGKQTGIDDEELRKVATACAIEAHPAYLLDNCPSGFAFGSSVLDGIITTTTNAGRELQTSKAPTRSALTVWFVTGNNIGPVGDTVRRTIRIALSSTAERPDEVEYTGPEVMTWARQERGKLFTAALTIAAAYIRAGRPDVGLRPIGSFEGWSALVRNAVVWAGLSDPFLMRGQFVAEDEEVEKALSLMDLIQATSENGKAVTAAEISNKVQEEVRASKPSDHKGTWTIRATPENGSSPATDAYKKLFPGADKPDSSRIGCQLRKFKNCTVDGRRIVQDGEDRRSKSARWRVIEASPRTSDDPPAQSNAGQDRRETVSPRIPPQDGASPAQYPRTQDLNGQGDTSNAGGCGGINKTPYARCEPFHGERGACAGKNGEKCEIPPHPPAPPADGSDSDLPTVEVRL